MPLPAILTGLGSAVGAGLSYLGNKDARKQIQRDVGSANNYLYETGNTAQDNIDWGYDAARPLYRDRFEYSNQLTAPYQQMGSAGRNRLMGLDPNIEARGLRTHFGQDPNISADEINRRSQFNRSPNITIQRPDEIESLRSGDMSDFYESPDYQFRLKNQAIGSGSEIARPGQGTLVLTGTPLRDIADRASDLGIPRVRQLFQSPEGIG